MKRMITAAVLGIQMVMSSGCATIVSGKTQDVTLRSTPPGADVLIDGSISGTTPMVVSLVRKKRHSISFKMNGRDEVVRATTRGFNWWYVGNLIFGGIIGIIVDPITGAMFSVKPGEVHVDFDAPAEAPPAAV